MARREEPGCDPTPAKALSCTVERGAAKIRETPVWLADAVPTLVRTGERLLDNLLGDLSISH